MADIRKEIERRRTFAIISHPDAGKTTLTEKLLLYGGAIQLAGSVKGKRTIGDAGNDEIAELAFKNGTAVQLPFKWTFPNGASVLFKNAVISVTANGAAASTSVAPLEFEVMSNGKPEYTPAA
jgi:hypothetical protein